MRAFLALEFPESVKGAYARALAGFRSGFPGLRWVDPAGLHLTLRFLGSIADDLADALRPPVALAAADVPSGRLVLGPPGSFGTRSTPRVLWFAVTEGKEALEPFQARLEEICREEGLTPEERPWTPHVTVARARDRRRRGASPGAVPTSAEWEEIARASGLPGATVPVEEVTLFSSRPNPRGAIYTPVWKERFKA